MTDKTFFDHVSDWFRILLKSGVPALLIGLGWLAVILGSFYFGGAWNNGAGFWVVDATGIMMNTFALEEAMFRFGKLWSKAWIARGQVEPARYGFTQPNKDFDARLTKAGVDHEFHVFPGGHGWEYMISVVDHSYGFLWSSFKPSGKTTAKSAGE